MRLSDEIEFLVPDPLQLSNSIAVRTRPHRQKAFPNWTTKCIRNFKQQKRKFIFVRFGMTCLRNHDKSFAVWRKTGKATVGCVPSGARSLRKRGHPDRVRHGYAVLGFLIRLCFRAVRGGTQPEPEQSDDFCPSKHSRILNARCTNSSRAVYRNSERQLE